LTSPTLILEKLIFAFAGRRHEQRAAELRLTELGNHRLPLRRDKPVCEGLAGQRVYLGKLGSVDRHDVVDVVQGRIVLDEDRQADTFGMDEIGAPGC
jgi:hypothetical protein